MELIHERINLISRSAYSATQVVWHSLVTIAYSLVMVMASVIALILVAFLTILGSFFSVYLLSIAQSYFGSPNSTYSYVGWVEGITLACQRLAYSRTVDRMVQWNLEWLTATYGLLQDTQISIQNIFEQTIWTRCVIQLSEDFCNPSTGISLPSHEGLKICRNVTFLQDVSVGMIKTALFSQELATCVTQTYHNATVLLIILIMILPFILIMLPSRSSTTCNQTSLKKLRFIHQPEMIQEVPIQQSQQKKEDQDTYYFLGTMYQVIKKIIQRCRARPPELVEPLLPQQEPEPQPIQEQPPVQTRMDIENNYYFDLPFSRLADGKFEKVMKTLSSVGSKIPGIRHGNCHVEDIPVCVPPYMIASRATSPRDGTMPPLGLIPESLMHGSFESLISNKRNEAFVGSCCIITENFVVGFAVRINQDHLLTARHAFFDAAQDFVDLDDGSSLANIKISSLDSPGEYVQVTVDYSILQFQGDDDVDIIMLQVHDFQRKFSMIGLAVAKLAAPTMDGTLVNTILVKPVDDGYHFYKTFGRLNDMVSWKSQYHSASTNPGSSGAPLYYNSSVVAIHVGYDEQTQRNVAIPIDFLRLLNLDNPIEDETPYSKRGRGYKYVSNSAFSSINRRHFRKKKHHGGGGGGGGGGGYSGGYSEPSYGISKAIGGATLKKGIDVDAPINTIIPDITAPTQPPEDAKIVGVTLKTKGKTVQEKKRLLISELKEDGKTRVIATKAHQKTYDEVFATFPQRSFELGYWIFLRQQQYLEDHPDQEDLPDEVANLTAWDKKTYLGQTIPPHLRISTAELEAYQAAKTLAVVEDDEWNMKLTDDQLSKKATQVSDYTRRENKHLLESAKSKDFHQTGGTTGLTNQNLFAQKMDDSKSLQPTSILKRPLILSTQDDNSGEEQKIEDTANTNMKALLKTPADHLDQMFLDQTKLIHSIQDSINSRIGKMDKSLFTILEGFQEKLLQCESNLSQLMKKPKNSSTTANKTRKRRSPKKQQSSDGHQEEQQQSSTPSNPITNLDSKNTKNRRKKHSRKHSHTLSQDTQSVRSQTSETSQKKSGA